MIAKAIRLATRLASPGGDRGRLSVFIFHRVLSREDPLLRGEPDAARFAALLDWIRDQFTLLDPLEACEWLVAGRLPARAAIITFDDGYRDNHDVALPLLQARGIRAAFFIATGYLAGQAMFNDRIIHAVRGCGNDQLHFDWVNGGSLRLDSVDARGQAVSRLISEVKHLPFDIRQRRVEAIVEQAGADAPAGLMMEPAHLRRLDALGMAIGGHTRWHPILAESEDDAARREIEAGRADLADILGRAPVLFAYPNGRFGRDYDLRHRDMVIRAGYRYAFSTEPGSAIRSTDPLQLPRFTPWDRRKLRFQARALRNLVAR